MSVTQRISLVVWLTFLALATFALAPRGSDATTYNATPATFASVYANAQGGDVIRLASGSYNITGKDTPGEGRIFIQAAPGASPQVSFNFAGTVKDLTIRNVTITSGRFTGSEAERITIANANVTGQIVIDQRDGFVNSGVVIRNSNFHGWHACSSCYEGQLSICGCGANANMNGVTVIDNRFFDITGDGIQDSGSGTRIIHNEFYALHKDDAAGIHADPIQTWDGSHHVIAGNYFHDLPETSVLMMPDGIDHEVIRDNVVATSAPYPYAFTVFDDNGSTIRNNTLVYAPNCIFGNACGGIRMGTKFACPGSYNNGTQVFNNIVGWINNECGTTSNRYNNLVGSGTVQADEVRGTATFVGGANPTSYCGYALTASSPGQGWGARTYLYC